MSWPMSEPSRPSSLKNVPNTVNVPNWMPTMDGPQILRMPNLEYLSDAMVELRAVDPVGPRTQDGGSVHLYIRA